ncbi:putative foot protein 1 variant 1-like [Penaeus vannamei]|uniref:Putative foot protein 1 variant 1-like n=1 Tax=Penaeus vannamei TaxID=6689 RepID=A0A423T2H5_PENVA|nr:putative foot protein 1 variant 1-like [Penaeus vannamei]
MTTKSQTAISIIASPLMFIRSETKAGHPGSSLTDAALALASLSDAALALTSLSDASLALTSLSDAALALTFLSDAALALTSLSDAALALTSLSDAALALTFLRRALAHCPALTSLSAAGTHLTQRRLQATRPGTHLTQRRRPGTHLTQRRRPGHSPHSATPPLALTSLSDAALALTSLSDAAALALTSLSDAALALTSLSDAALALTLTSPPRPTLSHVHIVRDPVWSCLLSAGLESFYRLGHAHLAITTPTTPRGPASVIPNLPHQDLELANEWGSARLDPCVRSMRAAGVTRAVCLGRRDSQGRGGWGMGGESRRSLDAATRRPACERQEGRRDSPAGLRWSAPIRRRRDRPAGITASLALLPPPLAFLSPLLRSLFLYYPLFGSLPPS